MPKGVGKLTISRLRATTSHTFTTFHPCWVPAFVGVHSNRQQSPESARYCNATKDLASINGTPYNDLDADHYGNDPRIFIQSQAPSQLGPRTKPILGKPRRPGGRQPRRGRPGKSPARRIPGRRRSPILDGWGPSTHLWQRSHQSKALY